MNKFDANVRFEKFKPRPKKDSNKNSKNKGYKEARRDKIKAKWD